MATSTESSDFQCSADGSTSSGNFDTSLSSSAATNVMLKPEVDEMAASSLMDFEYEMQLFGFSPKTFGDGLYNAIVDFFFDHLEAAMNTLKTEVGSNVLSDEQAKQAMAKIYNATVPGVDRVVDKMEVALLQAYLRHNVFNIPSYVLLQEDRVHADHPAACGATVAQLERQIDDIKAKIIAAKYMKAKLADELEELEETLEAEAATQKFQKLNDEILRGPGGLVEMVQATCDIMQKL